MKRLIFLLFALASINAKAQQKYVGGDISLLQSYEDNQVSYYTKTGSKINDMLQYLKSESVGWNTLRVRLFVNPQKKNPEGYTDNQVCQDLDYVVRLCKRIKAEGYALLLDFHYSDTWADPSNQWIPAAWASLTEAQLRTKVYEYTKECLQRLVDEGATPDFIQTGNEISYGMLWSATVDRSSNLNRCYSNSPQSYWTRFTNLLAQATKACREVCPNAKIILHSERSGDTSTLKQFCSRMANVDYDIIGLSYYPFWHKSLEVLSGSLDMLATDFPDKTVQIVETAYYYTSPGTVDNDFSDIWPYTAAGQAAFAHDLVEELKKHSNVNALYWWFPEENGNGPNNAVTTYWVNRGMWNNSSHRALQSLTVLKEFLDGSSSIDKTSTDAMSGTTIYFDLSGRKITSPTGLCIRYNGDTAQKIHIK